MSAYKENENAGVESVPAENAARKDAVYNSAKSKMNGSEVKPYQEAIAQFQSIAGWRDADECVRICLNKIEEIEQKREEQRLWTEISRKLAVYNSAKSKMNGGDIQSYEEAIKQFQTISGWRDSDECIRICVSKIEEIKRKQEEKRLEDERQKELAAREEAEKQAKRKKKIVFAATSGLCLLIAFAVLLSTFILPVVKYNNALALMEAEKFDKAISVLQSLGGYKDSAAKIDECRISKKYVDALSFMNTGKYTEAIEAFEAIAGYRDSVDKINQCKNLIIDEKNKILDEKYNNAIALLNAGNIVQAYEALIALDGYKDSKEKADSIYDAYVFKTAKPGDYIKFGSYEQDNNPSNGKEKIEWLVLDVKDGKALVISKYVLDCKKYNDLRFAKTWEDCTIRTWLNDNFVYLAFSQKEKEMIPTVTVSADKNPQYDTNSGKATRDKIFLLSISEAEKYFSSDSERISCATKYAESKNVVIYTGAWWWLRSPGAEQHYASNVDHGGAVLASGNPVQSDYIGIRPAMWIDLNA